MVRLLSAVFLFLALTCGVRADISLLGIGTLPGDSSDLSGLQGTQSDGTPHNRLGGLGSAIAYTGRGTTYILASDRGPKDGATECISRFHTMDIAVNPGNKNPVTLKLTGTTLLTDEKGTPFVGALTAGPRRLDCEGVRIGPAGTLFISDEYGPYLWEFDPSGKRLRTFSLPARFLPTKPSAKIAKELPPINLRGRQPNRGMEGLAISPDGRKLFGIMQSPLIQDGGLDKDNSRIGINNRLIEVDRFTRKTREFVYQLDAKDLGVSEILAVDDRRFLVLERDSKGGKDARVKKVYLIDLQGATDVSNVARLPTKKLPSTIVPVQKKLFLDLLDPRFALAGKDFPEKFEGLAFGPPLPDGRLLLLVTADNDFVATVPLRILAFAIDPADLPGYRAQVFDRAR